MWTGRTGSWPSRLPTRKTGRTAGSHSTPMGAWPRFSSGESRSGRTPMCSALPTARTSRVSGQPGSRCCSLPTATPPSGTHIIDLHWHDLRHEGACRLLADGVDLRAIQLILGHSDVKQTQRYLNVTDEELRKTLSELWQRRRNAQRGRRRMSRKHSGVRVPDRGGNSLSRAV
jgi:hypothetical protein